MNKNVQNTKFKLTIIFSVVVSLIIFILWSTYFSVKYYKQFNEEKTEFSSLIYWIESWKISAENLINWARIIENDFFQKKGSRMNKEIEDQPWLRNILFLNYIILDKNKKIVLSNIKDNIDAEFLFEIYENDRYYNLEEEKAFFIKKFKIIESEWTFILLKKLRYTFSDYLWDIFGFLILNIIFSILLYFIGRKFVDKTFIPVEENLKDMKDFIHNAWHELKTPISVMDSNIQLMNEMKVYDEEMLWELKTETKRLNSIIEALIKLSDIDWFKKIEKNNLSETIDEIIKEFKFKIKDQKIDIKADIDKEIIIKSNKDYFHIFLSNLIWNAIKYNKKWWAINIVYKPHKLIITDSWIWIKKEDINKIFDRFFKSDKSRTTEWFGIWLSLVKKISDIYNWEIKVESKENEWTSFIINF